MSDIIKSDDLARLQALLKCAESISNPVYSVSMRGQSGELKILAVRHFQGQICITVEDISTVQRPELVQVARGYADAQLITKDDDNV